MATGSELVTRVANPLIDAVWRVQVETVKSGIRLANRILPFDSGAARSCAQIVTERRTGSPISQADCQTLAIARSCHMVKGTRNIQDFMVIGVKIINPCSAGA